MKKGLFATACALLVSTGLAEAQEQLPPVTGSIMVEPPALCATCGECAPASGPRGWVSAEYLHWWITKGPIGVPLVTTGDPLSPTGGAIGDPSTRVLFGNSSVNYGGMNGGRLSMGYWFGPESKVGAQASGFLFQQRTTGFSASSDATGNPLLALPFQTPAGVEARGVIASPVPVPIIGRVAVTTTSQLWGADANGVVNLYRDCNLSIDGLAGFRYLDLYETLRIDANATVFVKVADKTVPFTVTVFDAFKTRNQFYGGQVGSRASYHTGRFAVDFLGMVALGSTQHTLSTSGAATATIGTTPVATPAGGIYTQPSNLGVFHTNSFSVVPQAQVKLGYDLTRNIQAFVGYDALYWSNVNRPGNQIDRVIGPAGSGRPAPQDNHSNLWAHGFNAGLQFRW